MKENPQSVIKVYIFVIEIFLLAIVSVFCRALGLISAGQNFPHGRNFIFVL